MKLKKIGVAAAGVASLLMNPLFVTLALGAGALLVRRTSAAQQPETGEDHGAGARHRG